MKALHRFYFILFYLYLFWRLLQCKIIIQSLINFEAENIIIRDFYDMNSVLF